MAQNDNHAITDPSVVAFIQQWVQQHPHQKRIGYGYAGLEDALRARGIPLPEGTSINVLPVNGTPTPVLHENEGLPVAAKIALAGMLGLATWGVGSALTGGGAGTGAIGASASPSIGGSLASTQFAGAATLPAVGSSGAVSAGLAGAGAAPIITSTSHAASSPSLWSSLVSPLIQTAGGLIGTTIASKAQNEAAKTGSDAAIRAAEIAAGSQDKSTAAQLQAAQDALAYQKDMQARKEAALSPYAQVGAGAIADLGRGYGFPITSGGGSGMRGPSSGPPAQTTAPVALDPIQPVAVGGDAPQPQQTAQSLAQLASAQTQSGVRPQVGEKREFGNQIGQWDGQGWAQVEA